MKVLFKSKNNDHILYFIQYNKYHDEFIVGTYTNWDVVESGDLAGCFNLFDHIYKYGKTVFEKEEEAQAAVDELNAVKKIESDCECGAHINFDYDDFADDVEIKGGNTLIKLYPDKMTCPVCGKTIILNQEEINKFMKRKEYI